MPTSPSVLKTLPKPIRLTIKDIVGPKEYFQTRKGLYVWSDFQNRILQNVKKAKEGTSFELVSANLVLDANDKAIESELPKKHLFTNSEICAILPILIEKQSKGQKGTLLNDGYSNIFYTREFVVSVRWVGSGWDVYAWRRDGSSWSAGRRVFSPASK